MSAPDRTTAQFEDSVLMRLIVSVADRLSVAAGDSRLLAYAQGQRRRAMRLDLSSRIRCGGVLIGTAVITHEGLLRIAPRQSAPAALHGILALVAISAAVAAWGAPRFAAAWRTRAGERTRLRTGEDAHG